jgi:FKBP-type peptidyl-prolyl cis-trans isomerase
MKTRWGRLSVFLFCGCAIISGCVAGPEDFVVESVDEAGSTSIAENDSESSEIIQVSSVKMEDRPAFKTTSSGLKYRILRAGKGRKPNANSKVTCHYKGWLDNGKEFDSSYGKNAASFALNGVVKGWTEGLQLIQEGGMIELEVPADLGYGPQGRAPVIPQNATLHFDIELLKVR